MNLIWLKIIIWITCGLSTLTGAILLVYLVPNLLYFIRAKLSGQPLSGRPPTKKPRKLWVLFWVSSIITILTSAIGSSLPDSLQKPPSTQTPPLTETYTLNPRVFPSESYLPTNTSTSTYSSSPTVTFTPPYTPTTIVTTAPTTVYDLDPHRGLDTCITKDYWTPYNYSSLSVDQNNCWQGLSDQGIYYQNRGIMFAPRTLSVGDSHAIFTRIPQQCEIILTIRIDAFITSNEKAGSVSIGIVPNDLSTPGTFLTFYYFPVTSTDFLVRDLWEADIYKLVLLGNLDMNTDQEIFLYLDGNLLTIYSDREYVDGKYTGGQLLVDSRLIPFDNPALSINYFLPEYSELKAFFQDINIQGASK